MGTKVSINEENVGVYELNMGLRSVVEHMPEGMTVHTIRLIPEFSSVSKYDLEIGWAFLAVFRPIDPEDEDRCHMQIFTLLGGWINTCYPTWRLLMNRGPNYPKTVEEFHALSAHLLRKELGRARDGEQEGKQGEEENDEN